MKLSVKELVLIALLSALLLVAQVGLAFLPNIEVVSLLVILYTLFFKKKTLYIIYIFALLEGLIYGFGIWWFMYLYVWTILWGIATLFKTEKSPVIWAFISGFFGLFFGTLCSVPYFITGGVTMGLSWIASGLMADVIHGIGNFIVTLVLLQPLHNIFQKVYQIFYQN
ncbi:MAG: hypothetical protein J6K04_06015 [Lachnospiraceae bacterium]|nr:hypothetical protein [Lachnospiraceae bacterium]